MLTTSIATPDNRESFAEVPQRSRPQLQEIWWEYIAHGGGADFDEFTGHLHGNRVLPDFEQRVLEHTLWELRYFSDEPAALSTTAEAYLATGPGLSAARPRNRDRKVAVRWAFHQDRPRPIVF